jgi:hypothetical protein
MEINAATMGQKLQPDEIQFIAGLLAEFKNL